MSQRASGAIVEVAAFARRVGQHSECHTAMHALLGVMAYVAELLSHHVDRPHDSDGISDGDGGRRHGPIESLSSAQVKLPGALAPSSADWPTRAGEVGAKVAGASIP